MRNALFAERPDEVARLVEAIRQDAAVCGLTHTFYRYPARFSPEFARAAIELFTNPGDLVIDPFLGGGTVAVEAMTLGRQVAGCDISSLSTFISEVKTTRLLPRELKELDEWIVSASAALNVFGEVDRPDNWIQMGYQRNLGDKTTWRIRKLLEQATSSVLQLKSERSQRFARCVILRTGQWALDGRRNVPKPNEFRDTFLNSFQEMRAGMIEFSAALKAARGNKTAPLLIQRSADGLDSDTRFKSLPKPKLIVTSPPYPGVYINYHRWKVMGRRETPAPFWIAESLDGSGLSHYTMGWRQEPGLKTYWNNLGKILTSLSAMCSQDTKIVQMVGFSEPEEQLRLYLDAMKRAGFEELKMPTDSNEGRIWRDVPGRRWYAAYQNSTQSTSQEVVLVHQKARK